MQSFPVHERSVEFCTDLGVTVYAYRSVVRVELIDEEQNLLRLNAIGDSGAPFSVIPYSILHSQKIPWQVLGSKLSKQGKEDPTALTWFGASCQLGETILHLLDKFAGFRSRPMRVIAKFPLVKTSTRLENEPILGYNFFTDNSLAWELMGFPSGAVGTIKDRE